MLKKFRYLCCAFRNFHNYVAAEFWLERGEELTDANVDGLFDFLGNLHEVIISPKYYRFVEDIPLKIIE